MRLVFSARFNDELTLAAAAEDGGSILLPLHEEGMMILEDAEDCNGGGVRVRGLCRILFCSCCWIVVERGTVPPGGSMMRGMVRFSSSPPCYLEALPL